MVYEHEFDGLVVQTGDLLCMTDGDTGSLQGQFWRLLGTLLPGPVDHVVIYLGPDGRCVEAGPGGVITFEMVGATWQPELLAKQRGRLLDHIYGVAYPLQGRGLSPQEEVQIREQVAMYCLSQVGKPYNLNFLNAETEDSFYCSQLAYKAYQSKGIDLNAGMHLPGLPQTDSIIFPREIWEGLPHQPAAMSGSEND